MPDKEPDLRARNVTEEPASMALDVGLQLPLFILVIEARYQKGQALEKLRPRLKLLPRGCAGLHARAQPLGGALRTGQSISAAMTSTASVWTPL